jgi:PAS domain S-box-containing protein
LRSWHTANSVLLADPEWRIEWVNEGFTRLSGYTLEDVRGRRPAELFLGPESDHIAQRAIEAADARGEPFSGELLNYHKDGSTYWVEIEIQPLFDESGRRVGYMALQLDITRRKLVEAELARRMGEIHRLALVASRTASSVAIMDPQWRIEWVNESFTRLFGYAFEEVKGRRPGELLHGPATSPETVAQIDAADERGELFKGDIIHYTKDRRPVWVRLEVQPLFDDDGRKLGYLGLHLDISELKRQTAELLAAKEAAEQANLAKGQFLAMMSHEIRTPMNGVIGMSSLLLETPLTPTQRDYAETIRQSGDALLTIIDDILDFSKIESGRLRLDAAVFCLRECVENVLDLLTPRAESKHLELLYEIEDDVPDLVGGDEARLRQILMNLLSNALKFTSRGEVVLRVRCGPSHGNTLEVQFAVKDTGIGISTEALSRLFQSFTQVDTSTTRRFGGTGLGLAISKRLTELMGGRMWVESAPGEGSTFSFVVQLRVETGEPRSGPPPGDLTPLRGKRLLIVDDNATCLEILSRRVSNWGVRPGAFTSGGAALERLDAGEQFDAALIDFRLPGGDGVALAREIRRRRAGARLPLLLLSTFGQREFDDQERHFAAYISKPPKPTQLLEALLQVWTTPIDLGRAASEPATPATSAGAVHAERILLAEDNPVNQKVAIQMLARLGYRADIAADGREVLRAMEEQPYDIVLMDVQMPEIDGLEATRRLRKRPYRHHRPWIIAVTANAMRGDRERCMAVGMDDYVSKPLKMSELAAALLRARESRG